MKFNENSYRQPRITQAKWTLRFIGISVIFFIFQNILGPEIWQYFAFLIKNPNFQ